MPKAESFLVLDNPLDKIIAHVALRNARKLMAEGYAAEEAATFSCGGAWAGVRGCVLAAIRSNDGHC